MRSRFNVWLSTMKREQAEIDMCRAGGYNRPRADSAAGKDR